MVGKTPKAQHAEGVWQRNQLNRAKGSRGNCPLRSPEAAPLVGLGATPQLFHGRPVMPNALNPAALVAGSAASLRSNFARPQTRPQAAFPTTCTLSRQMDATDQHREKSFSLGAGLFRCRDFASAEARRGLCARPLHPFAARLRMLLDCNRKFFSLRAFYFLSTTKRAKQSPVSPFCHAKPLIT